jgi:hypothetical protein
MKFVCAALYAAVLIFLSTTMTVAGAGTGVSSFINPQKNEFTAATAERPLSNAATAAFEQTSSHFNVSAAATGNPSSPVPEPATLLLLSAGLAGIGAARIRTKRRLEKIALSRQNAVFM